MALEVFPDKKWICLRLFIHLLTLALALVAASWAVGSIYFGAVIYAVVLICYAAVAYAQMKTPVLRISSDSIEITNIFYKGRSRVSLVEVELASATANAIVFETQTGRISLDLLGMGTYHKQESLAATRSALEQVGIRTDVSRSQTP